MKTKTLRDIIIGLLLISTLTISTILVSCSDEDGIIFTSSRSNQINQPYTDGSVFLNGLGSVFSAIGIGAGGEIGSVAFGWFFSAIGLTSHSGPNWNKQFAIIDNDLDSIISLLNTADNELASIDSVLNVINCSLEQTSLQTELAAIKTNYNTYKTYLLTASQGDTIPNTDLLSFSNLVLNGNGTQPSMPDALSNIQVNMGEQSGVIIACMQSIPKPPDKSFGQDTVYYAQAQGLLANYYYYQVIALGLISEANHYMAWVAAGAPGEEYASADSVQRVCTENAQAEINCNAVKVQTNTAYNSILAQFKFVGTGYTDENFLFQQVSDNRGIAWVRSLELFTVLTLPPSGECFYPLTNYNLCGPTAGHYDHRLTNTMYHGTQKIEFAYLEDMRDYLLHDISEIEKHSTVGDYLNSIGFSDMSDKIMIPGEIVKLGGEAIPDRDNYLDSMHVVPFIDTDKGIFTDCDHHKKAMYSDASDFCSIAGIHFSYYDYCGLELAYKIDYKNTSTDGNNWYYQKGYSQYCPATNTYLKPLEWNSKSEAPGWSYYQHNSDPQKRLLMPVRSEFAGSEGCLPGYANLNSGGVVTKCGSDLQVFINANLPVPPTCHTPNISPPCD